MFQNHFKIAFRNLWSQRFFTGLNLLGLAVGLAVSITLALFVKNELSFDRYHSKVERIYRVGLTTSWDGVSEKMATSPNITGPALKEQVKEVEAQVRLLKHNFGEIAFLNYGEKRFTEKSLYWADPSLFSIFDIHLLQGDPANALARKQTVVLSETLAKKIFGDEDPFGKFISVDNVDTLEVTGIFADLPANSTFDANLIGSFESVEWASKNLYWSNASYETFLLLQKDADPQDIAKQANAIHEKATPVEDRWFSMWLQPLADIHLKSTDIQGQDSSRIGDMSQVRILGMLALAVMLLACFNYMNLSTARSQQRFKEVGINKTLGASTGQMVMRYFVETGVMVALALATGLVLAGLTIPFISNLTGKGLSFGSMLDGQTALGLLVLWAVTTLGAGIYPALFLSLFSPKEILQPNHASGLSGHRFFRQTLVVSQFVICIGLMIATTVFYKQLKYISNKKLGYESQQVVAINTAAAKEVQEIDGLMNEARSIPAVKSLCRAQTYPSGTASGRSLHRPEDARGQSKALSTNHVGPGFEEVLGLKLLAGTSVPENLKTDTTAELVLNESAIKYMGWTPEEALGKQMPDLFWGHSSTVVGVVEDFHFESLHQPIGAYCFHNANSEGRQFLMVKLETKDLRNTMAQLEAAFKRNLPNSAFDYTFLDDHLDSLYRSERTLAKLVLLFSGMAIFIACLGLFGLAAFAAEQRTKEIGIRKVLGASVNGLVGLLAKDFLKPVLLAVLLASPLAWYWMDRWLENFAFHIDLHWTVFALVGLVAVTVAFLTVSFQSVKAALAKPVESLRSQ